MIKKSERLTKAICNKGFSGNSSILPRSNFGVGGQESSPHSLTAHSLNRCMKCLGAYQLLWKTHVRREEKNKTCP
jgi:hypothetical protein